MLNYNSMFSSFFILEQNNHIFIALGRGVTPHFIFCLTQDILAHFHLHLNQLSPDWLPRQNRRCGLKPWL